MNIKKLLTKKNIIISLIIILIFSIFIYFLFSKEKEEPIAYYLDLLGAEEITIYEGTNYQDEGYKAYDNKGNNYQEDVTITGNVNTNIVGEYTITYNYQNIEKTRIVNVISKVNQVTYLILKGEEIIYLDTGVSYIEPGYNVIDSNNPNLINEVEVTGSVDIYTPGTYKIYYSVTNSSGIKISKERTVIVRGRYRLELIGDNYLKHNLNEIYQDQGCNVLDEQGNKVNLNINVTGSVDVTKPGLYTIIYSIEYRGYKEEVIRTIEVLSLVYKCTGTINRYGTTLKVTGNNNEIVTFNVQGKTYNNNSKLEFPYQKITNAYILNNGNKVNCQITNNLIYNFKYDENNTKPFIKCNTYNQNDRTRLETTLKNAVNEAGYGTRAGVVEAARFLVGALDYKIAYLGPKKINSKLGRYNKVGLNIANDIGWGCMVSGWEQGIDCTNFVAWAFIQAGLQLTSVYSTSNTYKIGDIVNKLQVGDLLLTPSDGGNAAFSHVGIIIGIDNTNIYVAEATTGTINAVVVTKISKSNLPTKGKLSTAKLYKYSSEGKVTSMWVS